MEKGKSLIIADRNHVIADIKSSQKEYSIITTDRKDLEMGENK